jgi:hypothetical protein
MGLGFLPWEKILPPYILGPLLCLLSLLPLLSIRNVSWLVVVLAPFTFLFGAWGTYVWFTRRENVFDITSKRPKKEELEK